MKKISAVIFTVVFSAIFMSFFAFADSQNVQMAKIEVLKKGEVVKTYDIEVNNAELNARDTIQKALNYAQKNATENDICTVRLQKGSYYFYSGLNLYSNTCLDLGGSVIYRSGSCGSLIRFGKKSDVTYGYTGYKNISVKNGVLDGKYIGTSSLMRFAHAYNVEISNVTFRSTKDVQHLLTFAACNKVNINKCSFLNMQISEKLENYNCEAVQIDILKEGNFTYPAYDGTTTKNVTVSQCVFNNVPRGIGTHSVYVGSYFDTVKITDNTFYNVKGYAVSALNYINSSITNNKISNCAAGIKCASVTNTKLSHIYASYDSNSKVVSNFNTEISNNTITVCDNFYKNTSYAIKLEGKQIEKLKDNDENEVSGDFRISSVRVLNNKINIETKENNTYAIDVAGVIGSNYGKNSNVQICQNTVTFSASSAKTNYGIRIKNSSNIYTNGNKISHTSSESSTLKCGIICEDSSCISVVSNSIANTKSEGIKLKNVSTATVYKNTLKNTGSNAVYIYKKNTAVTVSSNKIYASGGYGICIRDSKAKAVKSNSIYEPKKVGIYVTGTAYAENITSNYICNSKGHGIYLNKSATSKSVSKNTVDLTSKKLDAISVCDSASVQKINGNSINAKSKKKSENLKVKCRYGINIQSENSLTKEIKENTVTKAKSACLLVLTEKFDVKIKDNSFSNSPYGVKYKKAILENNTYKKCTSKKCIKL